MMSILQPDISQYTGVNLLATIVTTSGIQESDGASPEASKSGDSEDEKKAIYSHPLFPLLVLLFEKCEQASQSADCPSSDSFDVDIQSFVQRQEKDNKPFFSDDPDLDNLMVKAIQVLRIHLLELEKVNDLCKDFCNRYINCLRGKLQSEQLLKVESDFEDSDVGSPPPTTTKNVPIAPMTSAASNMMMGQNITPVSTAMPQLGPGQIMSGGTIYQMVHTPQGLVAQPIQFQAAPNCMSNPGVQIHGSTPISQIGVNPAPPPSSTGSLASLSSNLSSDEDDTNDKRKSKRGVLPKSATQVMKSWLFQHIVHPYPTEDEKRQIAMQTNLTLLQVNNWFINARRRILQPMLEASNPDQVKQKKSKPQNRPLQRFWPESLANYQPQISPALMSVAPMGAGDEKSADSKDFNSNSEKNDSVSETKPHTVDVTDNNTLNKEDDS